MAIFLNENQIGTDTSKIGFPSLGDCMGVLVETPTALYGFHHMPNPAIRAAALKPFIKSHLGDNIRNAVCLYGCTRFGKRYNGGNFMQQWTTEMTEIATAIKYAGPVVGVNLSKASHTPKDNASGETVYLEFNCTILGSGCTINYKRMAKMTATPGNKLSAHGIVGVRMDNASGKYITGNTPHKITSNMDLDTGVTNSALGIMHTATKLIRFTKL